MRVYSMTGYGSVLRGLSSNPGADTGDAQLMLEIRSVNGRFLDLSLRLPDEFRHVKGPLRERVSRGVKRGKVELAIPSHYDVFWPNLNIAHSYSVHIESQRSITAITTTSHPNASVDLQPNLAVVTCVGIFLS